MIYGRISLQNNAFLIAFSVVFLQWPLQLLEHADHANQLVERLVYIHSQFCTALDQWNSELLCQVLRFIPANLQKPANFFYWKLKYSLPDFGEFFFYLSDAAPSLTYHTLAFQIRFVSNNQHGKLIPILDTKNLTMELGDFLE